MNWAQPCLRLARTVIPQLVALGLCACGGDSDEEVSASSSIVAENSALGQVGSGEGGIAEGGIAEGAAGGSMVGPGSAPVSDDDPQDPVQPEPVCDAYTQVFATSCTGSVCHDRPAFVGFAISEQAAFSFVGKPPVRNDPECGLMIDPLRPENSLILRKVDGTLPQDMSCGGNMPLVDELTAEQVDCIASWLTQFAE